MLFLEERHVLSVQEGTVAANLSTNAGKMKVTVTTTMTAKATLSAVKTTALDQALKAEMTAAMQQLKLGVMVVMVLEVAVMNGEYMVRIFSAD